MGIVAKRYVKALVKSSNINELKMVSQELNEIALAFSSNKFKNIILSPDINSDEKIKLILSFTKSGKKVTNLIKILNQNDKLFTIPEIAKELKQQISNMTNNYSGVIISNFKVNRAKIKELETNLSKKFNATIKLENRVTNYNGIKVELEDLGVEVSFSTDRLKAQIREHILKAI